ncbi:MAG: hypothetical protein P8L27_05870 [Flavobacteriaceae bacterium]|nr:hypothetical protein [Flavobacteriaceae bacterium]
MASIKNIGYICRPFASRKREKYWKSGVGKQQLLSIRDQLT